MKRHPHIMAQRYSAWLVGRPRNHRKMTRLYGVWTNMRNRLSKNNPRRKYYYDRGVKLCDEWDTYAGFREWALPLLREFHGDRKEVCIDRIDETGDYCPSNCQLLTVGENSTKACNVRWNKENVYV